MSCSRLIHREIRRLANPAPTRLDGASSLICTSCLFLPDPRRPFLSHSPRTTLPYVQRTIGSGRERRIGRQAACQLRFFFGRRRWRPGAQPRTRQGQVATRPPHTGIISAHVEL